MVIERVLRPVLDEEALDDRDESMATFDDGEEGHGEEGEEGWRGEGSLVRTR